MSGSLDDVLLSVRRYAALRLGEQWTLRLERDEVRDDARPAGVLEAAPLTDTDARATETQGDTQGRTSLTFTLYPSMEGSARECSRRARRLQQEMHDLVVYGLDLGLDDREPPRPVAGPRRVPLWDYAAVTNEGAGRVPPEFPEGRVAVEDFSVTGTQDPLDVRRWTVVLEMRVSWARAGRVVSGPLATAMLGSFTAEPSA